MKRVEGLINLIISGIVADLKMQLNCITSIGSAEPKIGGLKCVALSHDLFSTSSGT